MFEGSGLLHGKGTCGTPLNYDYRLLENIPPILGDTCRLVRRLTAPTNRLYIRVNTLKTSIKEFLEIMNKHGIKLNMDEEIPEAVWARVEGPLHFNIYKKKVVADKKAAESVLMGSDLYVPGVIEAKSVKAGDKVTIQAPNGVNVGSGIATMNSGEAVRLRKKARRGDKLGVFVKVTEPMYKSIRVHELPGATEGLFYGQSLPSMYVARILDPKPGEKIIDLTAAPGGKISHVAQLVGKDTILVAVDRPSKIDRLKETLEKLGMSWIKLIGADSRYLDKDYPGFREYFDKVILDPPCTNLGVIPKVMDSRTHLDTRNLSTYQFQLAKTAYRLLRKGGVLSYSVCTLTYAEAEAQVKRMIEELGFEPVPLASWVKRPVRTRYGIWFSPLLHGVTGFYISLLRKI